MHLQKGKLEMVELAKTGSFRNKYIFFWRQSHPANADYLWQAIVKGILWRDRSIEKRHDIFPISWRLSSNTDVVGARGFTLLSVQERGSYLLEDIFQIYITPNHPIYFDNVKIRGTCWAWSDGYSRCLNNPE